MVAESPEIDHSVVYLVVPYIPHQPLAWKSAVLSWGDASRSMLSITRLGYGLRLPCYMRQYWLC